MIALAEKLNIDAPLNGDFLAAFFKAAGDPLRLNILRLLHNNDYGVLELSQLLDIKQSSMSHHLKVLASASLVATRRDGNSIYYRRAALPAEAGLQQLHNALFAAIDKLDIGPELQQRINDINEERSRASRDFFRQNADRFQKNQDLIASYAQYGDSITDFLRQASPATDTVLEVGPGEGHFLADLAPRFRQVIALDNSPEMLARARQFAAAQQLKNIRFIEGDTATAVHEQLRCDCITLNMVLHHTPEPAQVFADLAKLLKPEGSLLLTELCQHDQNWARQSCGDLWLGFAPDDLSQWATTAGLCEGESLFLTQRNGFQIQLRQFVASNSH